MEVPLEHKRLTTAIDLCIDVFHTVKASSDYKVYKKHVVLEYSYLRKTKHSSRCYTFRECFGDLHCTFYHIFTRVRLYITLQKHTPDKSFFPFRKLLQSWSAERNAAFVSAQLEFFKGNFQEFKHTVALGGEKSEFCLQNHA